jgi:phospholipid:diacylglycerol acyltransferase
LFSFSGYSYGFYKHTDYCSSALLLFNTSYTDESEHVKSGVYLGPGDATVPLVSLGHMCAGPWKQHGSFHNPGQVQSIIREYVHKTTSFDILTTRLEDALRGGEYAVTHVEILGNREFLNDLLIIVSKPIKGTNQSHSINDDNIKQDRIYSNIRQMSDRIMKRNKD